MNSHFLRAGLGLLTLLLVASPFSARAVILIRVQTTVQGVLPLVAPNLFLSDKEGNTIAIGGTVLAEEPDETVRNIRVVRLGVDQQPGWSALYDPAVTTEQAFGAARDGAGNVYVTGVATLDGFHESVTLKYNGAGEAAWTNRFRPLGSLTTGRFIAAHDNGSAAVIYYTDTQAILGKLNSNGETAWTYPLGNPAVLVPAPADAGESGAAVAFDPDGNVLVTSSVALNETNGRPVVRTVKLNAEGVPLWTNRFEKGMDRHTGIIPQSVVSDRFGNVFVAGFSSRVIASTSTRTRAAQRMTILSYSPKGRLRWVRHLRDRDPLAYMITPRTLMTDTEGGVYITGARPLPPRFIGDTPSCGIHTARFTWKGELVWRKRHSLGVRGSYAVRFVRANPARVTLHLDEALDPTGPEGSPWLRTSINYLKDEDEED